jgi:hypothetical protein
MRQLGVLSRRRERMPGVKLREKGKKESQVFTSVADNPRRVCRFPFDESIADSRDGRILSGYYP